MVYAKTFLLAAAVAVPALAQDSSSSNLLDIPGVALPTLSVSLSLPTDLPLTSAIGDLIGDLPLSFLFPTSSSSAMPMVPTMVMPSMSFGSISASPSGSMSGGAGGANTGAVPTGFPSVNGGGGSNNNSTSGGGSGIGANGSGNNGTSGGGSGIGANGSGVNGTDPNGSGVAPISSMTPSAIYTAIINQSISITAVLAVITSLTPAQLLAAQNAVSASAAAGQTCYAPVVCLTNPSAPGTLAGSTLVVSTLNGQTTTLQIPSTGGSGQANYVTSSSGAGTLKNAAAAVQAMTTLPASSSSGASSVRSTATGAAGVVAAVGALCLSYFML